MKPDPSIIFMVGTGRCGSSLIHELFCKDDKVGFISNIDDRLAALNLKGRFNNALFRSYLGNFTRKGAVRFAPSEAYRLISRQVSPSYANSCRDLYEKDAYLWLVERYKNFFYERIRLQKKGFFSHKYTGWSRIGFFNRIFPDAKFIHVVRDGRAVANSFLQMPWWDGYKGPENWLYGNLSEPYLSEWIRSGKSFVTLAGIAWKILIESYEESRVSLNDEQYLEVLYEDFLQDPIRIMRSMFEFCGIAWSSSYEKVLQRQSILSARKDAYRRDLTEKQIVELEQCLFSKLNQYGYA